jgi:hypothetical protein
VRFNYRHRRAYNNTDGAFSVSPSGSLDDQWGPAGGDTWHRLRASVSTQAYRNLNAQMSWDTNSGAPYTITTGIDENGDSIFNDRPFDVPRNSARLPGVRRCRPTCPTRFRSARRRTEPGRPEQADDPVQADVPEAPAVARAAAAVRRASRINVSAQNFTNRHNYSGFSGVMTSQYFLQATSVSNPRQVDISVRFNF